MFKHQEKLYAAVDVGTTKVCTIVARAAATGGLEVVGLGITGSRGMHKGMVVDAEETQHAVHTSVEEARRTAGCPLPPAHVGFTGSHLTCQNVRAAVDRANQGDRTISRKELEQVLWASQPLDVEAEQREVVQVVPRGYVVDGVRTVGSPAGQPGQQVMVESHLVRGERSPVEQIIKTVRTAGIGVKGLVLEPLASAEAALTADERELGVVLVDIGGGTSDIALFQEGSIWHTSVLPVGGYQLTNDIAIAYRTTFLAAEEAKLRYGHLNPETTTLEEEVTLPIRNGAQTQMVPRRELCQLLRERMRELLALVVGKAQQAGLTQIPPAGLVFAGGSAKLPGLQPLATEALSCSARIGIPRFVGELPQELLDPAYATSVGILLWSVRHQEGEMNAGNAIRTRRPGNRVVRWISRLLPTRGRNGREV